MPQSKPSVCPRHIEKNLTNTAHLILPYVGVDGKFYASWRGF